MKYLLLLFIFIPTLLFAVEKITHKEVDYSLTEDSEIKNKLRVEFHDDGIHKKIKPKDDKTGFEVVDK